MKKFLMIAVLAGGALLASTANAWGWMPWDWFDDDDHWGYPGYGYPGYGGGYPYAAPTTAAPAAQPSK
jgi:hypothetical protein